MKKCRLLALASLLIQPLFAFAADTNNIVSANISATNPVVTLPGIMITATRIYTTAADSPNSITVITREQIEQSQQQLVADVLRDVPGIEVARTGQPGSLDSVFMRGANNNQTLVLVDGIRVNNAFNNEFDFSVLSVDNIDHIEILRGPQSTLYGSEAAGGVINIVTLRGSGPPSGWAETEYGSFNTLLTRGGFSVSQDKLSVAANASYTSSDNEGINNDYEQYHFDGHMDYELGDRFSATLLAMYFHNDDGSAGDIYTEDPTARLKTEDTLLGLTLQGDPTTWWNTKLTLSRSHERGNYDDPYFDDFSDTIAQRNQVDYQNVFTPSDHHTLLVGGTYENTTGNYSDNVPDILNNTIDTYSAYAQYDFMPIERVTLTAGGRVDDSSSFGTHETYRFGGRFTAPCTETIFRATVGTGFRAPSIEDLYFPGYNNPNLRPEESFGWDAGIEQPLLQNKLHLGATFFYNNFDNLIEYSGILFSPVNVGHARTYGVETFATWQLLTNLTARASYTWLHSEDLDTGMELIRRPENGGSIDLNWKICPHFEADGEALFVGSRADDNFDDPSLPPNVTVPGYTKLDMALRWHVQKHLELFARGDNLLNEGYQEVFGYPALGRGFYGGLRVEF